VVRESRNVEFVVGHELSFKFCLTVLLYGERV
jgi:hypothetical protein